MTTRRTILRAMLAVAGVSAGGGSRRGGAEETDGSSVLTLRGHDGWVASVAFSPAGWQADRLGEQGRAEGLGAWRVR